MKINLLLYLTLSVLTFACKPVVQKQVEDSEKLSLERKEVSKEPIAVFEKKYKDDLNDFRFSVRIYETPKTLWYRMAIEDRRLAVNDTVVFPNLGVEIKPVLKKGKKEMSCLLGFLDQQGNFMGYKEISSGAKGLTIKQTHTYYMSHSKMAK
ncbi:hypothetical protein D3C72_664450 [compost metagenome]